MPTPHGDHGLAFGMAEVKLLRRALLLAMKAAEEPAPEPGADPAAAGRAAGAPAPVDFWLLDRAIADAEGERERLRDFHLAELALQRAAVPGTAATYLPALTHAMSAYGYIPTAADLAALRTVADLPCAPREHTRREALLAYCSTLADHELETRLTARARNRDPA